MNVDLSDQYDPPPHRRAATGGGCGRGCITAVVVVLILVGVGVTYVVFNFKSLAARAVAMIIEKTIEESDLPADQKLKLIARVGRLRDDYLDGKITDEQLRRVAEEIADGPLLLVGTVYFIETQYVAKSGLSEEEKKAAKLTLQRVARGVHEEKISEDKLDPMFRIVSTTDADGNVELKETVTDAELRDFLKLAEKEADNAEIPQEPMQIDLAEELDKAIERAMKEPEEVTEEEVTK